MQIDKQARYFVQQFLVAEQLYTHPCVSVCLFVPRFVYPLFRTSTKAWMTPGSDQQYSGLQTDDQATTLGQTKIPHKLRGFLSATSFSMKILLSHKKSLWLSTNSLGTICIFG
jgi:hypothetical protein